MKFLKSFFFPLIYFLTSQSSHAKVTISSVSWQDNIDQFFGEFIVAPLASFLFWPIPGLQMPLIVAWLLGGAIFFTFKMGFVNIRFFKHAIDLVRGKYDTENSKG